MNKFNFINNIHCGIGIHSGDCNNNCIYLNNFENNGNSNAFDGSNNFWSCNGIGNYWDDYNGTDANNDGIGDDPYVINFFEESYGNNKDEFPLMAKWIWQQPPIHNIDNSSSYYNIQSAVEKAHSGDTIHVDEGFYCGNILIDKKIRIIGKNKISTVIIGERSGSAFEIIADNVNITEFGIINNGATGIKCYNASSYTISQINFMYCKNGIYAKSSNNATISYNTFSKGITNVGMDLYYSEYNVIYNNEFYDNSEGIRLSSSSYNIVNNNSFSSNSYGILIWVSSQCNLIINNTCIDNGHGIAVYESNENRIVGNNCSDGVYGIHSRSSEENIYEGNQCHLNTGGMELYHSRNNIFINNSCKNNRKWGIYINVGFENLIKGNNCSKNKNGIGLSNAISNKLYGNICLCNNDSGVGIAGSFRNIVKNNLISSNKFAGIELLGSLNTIIRFNNICLNEKYGIFGMFSISNARYNWWGSKTGPSGRIFDSGETISCSVGYIYTFPWLLKPLK